MFLQLTRFLLTNGSLLLGCDSSSDSGSELTREVKLLSDSLISILGQKEQKGPPPMITNFLSYDLLNPDQVKFRVQDALVLPCGASGTNLKWSWYHNDTKIPEGALKFGNKRLGRDGTLTGSFLGSADSGTYQCFVEDTVSGVKTFSRKIRVAVTGEVTDASHYLKRPCRAQ